MKRIQKIERQIELCRLLSEMLCEEAENALPYDDHKRFDENNWVTVDGHTRLCGDIVKLRRELLKLGKMLGGEYER